MNGASEIARALSQNPKRSLAFSLLSLVAPLSWSNLRLMLLACTLPELVVESVASAHQSAVTSSPLYSGAQDGLFLLLTTITLGYEKLPDLSDDLSVLELLYLTTEVFPERGWTPGT